MAELEIDREIVLIVPFLIGAAVTTGLVEGNFLGFYDLSTAWYDIPGAGAVTPAMLLSIGSLLAVVVNRDRSIKAQLRGYAPVEMWVVYVTVGLIIAPPLVPTFTEFLSAQPAAMIAVAVQAAGFGLVSYVN